MSTVSKISFGSTYKTNLSENGNKYYRIGMLDYKELDKNAKIIPSYTNDDISHIIVIDDKYDDVLESYFKQQDIKFHRKTNAELFSEEDIKKRIKNPIKHFPYTTFMPNLVNINTKKFDKTFIGSFQYIGDYATMDRKDKYDSIKEYIKTGLPIDAPVIYIRDRYYRPEITFENGRHKYAFLRDMGIKSIPVAMDKESFKVGSRYGILEEG